MLREIRRKLVILHNRSPFRQEVKDYRKREEAYLTHNSNLYMSENEDEENDIITQSFFCEKKLKPCR